MKKLILSVAIAAIAGIASAASVNWNTGALKNINADGTWSSTAASSSVGVWLATATFYTDNAGTMGGVATDINLGLTDNSINDMTSALNGSAKTAAVSTYYWIVLELSYKANATAEAQTLTLDPYRFQTVATGNTALNFTTLGLLDNTHSFSPAAVPEPTSGLLLLLGVAGMALRRRRA